MKHLLLIALLILNTAYADIYCMDIDEDTKYCWSDDGKDWLETTIKD